ncbi:hypothetical protein NQ317_007980, partial [Molorchus minor]
CAEGGGERVRGKGVSGKGGEGKGERERERGKGERRGNVGEGVKGEVVGGKGGGRGIGSGGGGKGEVDGERGEGRKGKREVEGERERKEGKGRGRARVEENSQLKGARKGLLCLIDTLAKLYERMVRNRIDKALAEGQGLAVNQYGFRKGRSTIKAIEEVRRMAWETEHKWTVLVTLDVRNAFNTASWAGIMQALGDRIMPKLELAPEKTEAVIMKGPRRRQGIRFHLNDTVIEPRRAVKYLGVWLDDKGNFGEHVRRRANKAEERMAALNRLMPNINGPNSRKREAMKVESYRLKLEKVQRKALLRIASAYRTVSTRAVQVVTGVVPIELMVEERKQLHERGRQLPTGNQKGRKGEDIGEMAEDGLTGHGSFKAYTKRIGKTDNDLCRYCEQVDTAEHTIFHCERWSRLRQEAAQRMNMDIGPENIVGEMISDREKWNAGHDMIRKIMEEKEREERADQERLEREGEEENLIG